METQSALAVADVKAFYDRFGARQDAQSFYEDAALDDLIQHSAFESAHHVFEVGCGTGRLAQRILRTLLPRDGVYEGVDVSTTMVGLASVRLREFGARASVREIDGSAPLNAFLNRPDRIVGTYVLDLMPESEIVSFMDCAARAIGPRGRLCMVSLTFGTGMITRAISAGWYGLFRLSPRLVGGCRPIRLSDYVSPDQWRVLHCRVVSSWGISSEVLVAESAM